MELTNNTVLVTGGGSGIGRGLAEEFHRLGNTVIIAGRRESQLDTVVAANPGMHALRLDQSDAADIRRFADELIDRRPELNVIVNNAGVQWTEDLLDLDVAAAETTVTTNFLGPVRLIAALLPTLLKQPSAAILNVTSALAFVPQALTPTYCATKAALHSYTQSLRFQLRATGVQVIELVPAWVQTGLQGERGHNPHAMPLSDYIAETMALLANEPQADEIVVSRARPMRNAERDGVYDRLFLDFNDSRTADPLI